MTVVFDLGLTFIRVVLILLSSLFIIAGGAAVPEYIDARQEVDPYNTLSSDEQLVFDVAMALDQSEEVEFNANKRIVKNGWLLFTLTFGLGVGLFSAHLMLGDYRRSLDARRRRNASPGIFDMQPAFPTVAQAVQAPGSSSSTHTAPPSNPVMTAPPTPSPTPPPAPAQSWEAPKEPIVYDDLPD